MHHGCQPQAPGRDTGVLVHGVLFDGIFDYSLGITNGRLQDGGDNNSDKDFTGYFGISPQTFYRWRRRYDPQNLRALEDGSHRPHRRRLPDQLARTIERVDRLHHRPSHRVVSGHPAELHQARAKQRFVGRLTLPATCRKIDRRPLGKAHARRDIGGG